jgi:putative endonuclease
MSTNKEIGKLGEDIGVKYLKNKGYKILDRNFEKRAVFLKFGEIDIIAQKDKIIIFCEVKTLSSEKRLSPEERVDFKKKETIAKIAEIWLDEYGKKQDTRWQIDVLAIVLDFNSHKAKIRHFENI